LEIRRQEPGESIESFARDIKLIGHKAYPNDNSVLLEKMLIKVFTNGLRDDKSRERVMLQRPETLTDAAKYACISETVVRVARSHSAGAASSSASAITRLGAPHVTFERRVLDRIVVLSSVTIANNRQLISDSATSEAVAKDSIEMDDKTSTRVAVVKRRSIVTITVGNSSFQEAVVKCPRKFVCKELYAPDLVK
jgi:hypothetical protein